MDKAKCQRCYQKHECVWDEQSWTDGFVSCPTNLIRIGKDGQEFPKSPEVNILKQVFSLNKISEEPPKWCE